MKLRRTTLGLLLAAALLGGGLALYELQASQQSQTTATPQKLVPFEEQEIQAVTVKTPKTTLSFTRVARSPQPSPAAGSSTWQMTAPKTAPANDASVAYLLSEIATGQSDQSFTISPQRQAEFGLDQPLATIDLKLTNGKTHQIVLGKPNFNRTGLYALINAPTQAPTKSSTQPPTEQTVKLVSMDFETAVQRPLDEWYALPPSPSPSPVPKQ